VDETAVAAAAVVAVAAIVVAAATATVTVVVAMGSNGGGGGVGSKGDSDGRGDNGDDIDNCGSCDSDGDDDGNDAVNDEDDGHDDDDTTVAAVRALGSTKTLWTIKNHHNSTAGEKNFCSPPPSKSPRCLQGGGAPSMKVEVSSSFLLSAHVSKVFTFQKFCSTYIHRNSILQKTYREGIGIAYIHT
jgi:hypothetical protein